MILVAGGIKGGTGKTTLAVNLAIIRAAEGRDVLLVDADDQGSASEFTVARTEEHGEAGYTCVALSGKAVRDQIKRLRSKYDDVIIDTGGRDTTTQRSALSIADAVLIPFGPRSLDLWTLEQVEDIIDTARAFNSGLVAYSVINKADHQGRANAETEEALSASEEIRFLPITVGVRKSFGIAFDDGQGITEYKPKDRKAIAEITALYESVFDTEIAAP